MQVVEAKGAKIPCIGLGTWTLKGDECAHIVSQGIKAGYRHIDTAAMYDNEQAVGEGLRAGIAASGLGRDDIFVTTKVWFTDIGAGALETSAENSLEKLGLDQVDLLLIHWPSDTIALSGSIKALNNAANTGLTRHIGVSNFPVALLDEACQLSERPLVCNQVEYHPCLNQDKVLAACRGRGMAMTAYCPLFRGGDLFNHPAITDAAKAHDKSPAQIILRWHIEQDGIVAIPRTSKPERLAENIDIFDFSLNAGEIAAISACQSANQRICDYEFSPKWDAA